MSLHSIEEMPPWLRFNRFIRTGYRPPMAPREAFKSLFYLHNESVNIWGHLIPALALTCLWLRDMVTPLIRQLFSTSSGDLYEEEQALLDASPFAAQHAPYHTFCLATFTFIFFASVCYHLFMPCCCSTGGYRRLICVDVMGALLSISSSAFSFLLYGDPCRSSLETTISCVMFLALFIAVAYVIMFSSMSVGQRFMLFGVHCLIRAVLCVTILLPRIEREGQHLAFYYHSISFLSIMVGGMVNALRIPERWMPDQSLGGSSRRIRWMDFILNSHNIWHFFCIHSCMLTLYGCYYSNLEFSASPCIIGDSH